MIDELGKAITFLSLGEKSLFLRNGPHIWCMLYRIGSGSEVARGKFVSGAKVLAAVPSISQRRRICRELHQSDDRLEAGGEAVVNKD